MVDDANVRSGQCHCGAVRFEATLSDGFNSILRCTCSYCRMRGVAPARCASSQPTDDRASAGSRRFRISPRC
jgi:hypothetical protein